MRNNCEKCELEDQEVRGDFAKHMDGQALTVIALSLAGFMRNQGMLIAKMPATDIKRVAIKRDQDFTGAVLGKILTAMPQLQEKAILKVLKKQGIEIQIKSVECKHEKEIENEQPRNEA
jgi:hypothetical protein